MFVLLFVVLNRQGSYDEVMSVLPAVERPVLVTFFRPESAGNTTNTGIFQQKMIISVEA
jgi:hypothetical protein